MQGNNSISTPVVTPPLVIEYPKSNNYLVMLLSILLIISVAISGFFAFQTQKLVKELTLLRSEATPVATVEPLTTNSAIATADPTANWKTYTNPNFSFKYPDSLKVGEIVPEYIVKFVDSKLVEKIIMYQGQFADGTDNPNSKFEYSAGKIQNQESKIQKNYSYNKLVQISYEFKVNDEDTIMSFVGIDQEVIDQILSTFKFTN